MSSEYCCPHPFRQLKRLKQTFFRQWRQSAGWKLQGWALLEAKAIWVARELWILILDLWILILDPGCRKEQSHFSCQAESLRDAKMLWNIVPGVICNKRNVIDSVYRMFTVCNYDWVFFLQARQTVWKFAHQRKSECENMGIDPRKQISQIFLVSYLRSQKLNVL